MSKRNGANKFKGRKLERVKSPTLEFVDGNGSETEVFRGFSKVPTVFIERFDITPFLPSTPTSISSGKTEPQQKRNKPSIKPILKENSRNAAALPNSSTTCSVYLFNDNLEELKDIFNKKLEVFDDLTVRAPSNMNLKCKICKKVYSSEKKLQNHQENKHMIIYKSKNSKSQKRVSFSDKVIVHELEEYHKCRKCPKIFESYKMLKGHMKEQHKKRKCYICNYCMKKFIDRMFFKVHIKLHCDACGMLFSSKTKCTDHRRNVCKTLKYHKCKTCQLNFFKLMDLKDHSYEHNSISCCVCDICKDQCLSKCAMVHHVYFLHSRKRRRHNPSLYITKKLVRESLFLCKFCDETTLDRDLIERHVELLPDLTNRAMTGYKDYYFCDQCLKKFDTETDMLQHKWTHFLKTPDNSQLRAQTKQETEEKKEKTVYNINEKIPEFLQPKLVLEKIQVDEQDITETVEFIDVQNVDSNNVEHSNLNGNKSNVEPKPQPPKKPITSKHQCQTCGKYYSSNYCLKRHIDTCHSDYENLRCKVCEEVFVWPSLLQSHKCIRLHIPEMPFEDARPEIHFDNLHQIGMQDLMNGDPELNNGFDDFNIDTEDYIHSVDFEIPAPIVELTEQENVLVPNLNVQNGVGQHVNKVNPIQNIGYKIVMQEVPIEF